MKRLITFLLIMSASAFAQSTAKEVVAVVGSEYNPVGSPKVTAVVGGFYPIADKSFAGVVVDLAFKSNQQPGVTFRPEYLTRILSINNHDIFGIVGLGAQFQASDPTLIFTNIKAALGNVGTNLGYSAATGITTNFRIGKSNFYIAPAFRVVKGSLNDTQFVGGVVLATKIQISQ